MTMPWVLLAALILPGMLLSWAVLPRPETKRAVLLDALAFGPLLGLGLATMLDFALRLTLDRGLGLREQGGLALVIAIIAAFVARRREPDLVARRAEEASIESLALLLLAIAVGLGLVLFLIHQRAQPDGGWDGMAVWGLLGRTLFASPGNPSRALHEIVVTQTEYPAFLPGSLALLHRAAGFDSPWPGQVMGFVGFSSLVLIGHRLLERLAGTTAAHLGALLLATTPTFFMRAADQYADTIVAAENLAAVGFVVLALERRESRSRHLLLAGFFLALLLWTKSEGLILAAVILTCAAVFICRRKDGRGRDRTRGLASLLGGALPGVLALTFWWLRVAPDGRRIATAGSAGFAPLFELGRWRAVLSSFGREFATRGEILGWNAPTDFNQSLQRWGYYWLAVVVIFVVGLRRGRSGSGFRFTLAVALSQLLAYVLVFVLIPGDQAWQLDNAAHRLLMHLAPLCLLSCWHMPELTHRAAQA